VLLLVVVVVLLLVGVEEAPPWGLGEEVGEALAWALAGGLAWALGEAQGVGRLLTAWVVERHQYHLQSWKGLQGDN
jgi:hypothetical protein